MTPYSLHIGTSKADLSACRETPGLGEPHSRSGRFEEGKSLLVLLGIEPRIVCPVAKFGCYPYSMVLGPHWHYRTLVARDVSVGRSCGKSESFSTQVLHHSETLGQSNHRHIPAALC